ncbi:Ubiquinone/menaquinone biosynthesis C-methyltransferase UbiE [bacterium HR32]|nr:Ubiquinone/menaquinone biosynthesis C-methyltransferase UbiE [bacterium HR32]
MPPGPEGLLAADRSSSYTVPVVPDAANPERKRAYVRAMFSAIARRYDLLNSLLSLGLHKRWKRYAVELATPPPGGLALDVCCGTGDLALLLKERLGPTGRAVGVDFAEPMVRLARQRGAGLPGVWFVQADAEALPFPQDSVDVAAVGFGVRNVARVERALEELWRVLKPGGRLVVLEFSAPRNRMFAALYDFYSYTVVPWLGRRLSRHPDAYLYLPTSIRSWPDQDAFADRLRQAGFVRVGYRNLLFGAVAVHVADKPGVLPQEPGLARANSVKTGPTGPREVRR